MQISLDHMPAEEALFLGAAFAHIAAHNEHVRQQRRMQRHREDMRLGRYARRAF